MSDWQYLTDYLNPISTAALSNDEGYQEGQWGNEINIYDTDFPDLDEANIVLVGCPEKRGMGMSMGNVQDADEIRAAFYALYCWHGHIKVADVGNIKKGNHLTDTYAALRLVVKDLITAGKTVVILGGSHDLTLAQYQAYAIREQLVDVVNIDAAIDLSLHAPERTKNFLLELLTNTPNYVKHYNHIAFQSYFVHPNMLETLDKLRFDCFRLGWVKEKIEEVEPLIRYANMVSFDVAALANAYAPANHLSPNGLTGEEACILMQYAGMSDRVSSLGLYGYLPEKDVEALTAKQLGQMLWYFIDGKHRSAMEAELSQRDQFNEFHMMFADMESVFLQSKRTGRWWMQLPDKSFVPCSYTDYLLAGQNEIPERWIRAIERN